MKKKQDHFLEGLRWVLILFFFGIMLFGFHLNSKRVIPSPGPQIEVEVSEPSKNE